MKPNEKIFITFILQLQIHFQNFSSDGLNLGITLIHSAMLNSAPEYTRSLSQREGFAYREWLRIDAVP
jgi:hypothetical protein